MEQATLCVRLVLRTMRQSHFWWGLLRFAVCQGCRWRTHHKPGCSGVPLSCPPNCQRSDAPLMCIAPTVNTLSLQSPPRRQRGDAPLVRISPQVNTLSYVIAQLAGSTRHTPSLGPLVAGSTHHTSYPIVGAHRRCRRHGHEAMVRPRGAALLL